MARKNILVALAFIIAVVFVVVKPRQADAATGVAHHVLKRGFARGLATLADHLVVHRVNLHAAILRQVWCGGNNKKDVPEGAGPPMPQVFSCS